MRKVTFLRRLPSKQSADAGFLARKVNVSGPESGCFRPGTLSLAAIVAVVLSWLPVCSHAAKAWVDVTSSFVQNPSFADGTKDGWQATGYYSAWNVQYDCMEFWNGSFTLSQQLHSLPAGQYRLRMQGFYRTRDNQQAYQAHQNHTENITAMLYAGDVATALHSVYDHQFADNLANNCWGYGNWWTGYVFFPNGMASAHDAFLQGLYQNELLFQLDTPGDVTIGVKNAVAVNDNWCIFDNFRLEYYADVAEPTAQNLQLSEIMSANIDQFWSPSVNFDSWMEIHNPTGQNVLLAGCCVSDEAANPTKWRIPEAAGVVPAGGYALIWFDHNELDVRQAPFKLDTDGGTLLLSTPDGQLIASQTYPPAVGRTSYCRLADGSNQWALTDTPTPGAPNAQQGCEASQQLPPPEVRPLSQLFSGQLTVQVSYPAHATLRYTTDGSLPTPTNGSTATPGAGQGTFSQTITATTNYRFRLFAPGQLPSEVVTRSYIKRQWDFTVPVVSVVADNDFLYGSQHGVMVRGTGGKPGHGQASPCNWNMDWDRPASFFLLDADGSQAFQQDVSLSMCGGWSRAWEPHSFKLKANKKYGTDKTLDHVFFAQKPYIRNRTLQMRNGGNDNQCRFKDPALQTMLLRSGIDIDAQAYQPVVHYLNGKYIGVINMREPNNKHFVFANKGWDDDEIDLFEMDPDSGYVQKCGTRERFMRWYELSQRIGQDGVYDEICQMVDVDEYINYMAALLYLGTDDWPQNNLKGYLRHDSGRWRFVAFDLDFAFNATDPLTTFFNKKNYTFNWLYDKNMSIHDEIRMVTIFQNMLQNDTFRRQFVDTYCLMGGSVFEKTRATAIIDELASRVEPMMRIEGASPWNTANDMKNRLANWLSTSTNALKRHSAMRLQSATMVTAQLAADTKGATLYVNNLEVPYADFRGRLFLPATIRAEAPQGYEFVGWRSGATGTIYSADEEIEVPSFGFNFTAEFRKQGATSTVPLRINEVSAANDSYVCDYYKRSDWVELVNLTDDDIDAEGLFLSDDAADPHKYRIGSGGSQASTVVPARGHLIVWCDKREPLSQLHASFKLADEGGEVVLTAADDTWHDVLRYPAHTMDQTVARIPDGGDRVCVSNVPTIGRRNVRTSYLAEVPQEASGISVAEVPAERLGVRYVVGRLVVESGKAAPASVVIMSAAGGLVKRFTASIGSGRTELALPHLATGCYVVRVASHGLQAQCKMAVF